MNPIDKIMLGGQIFSGCSLDQYGRLLKASQKYPEFFDVVNDKIALTTLVNVVLANGDILEEDVTYLQSKGLI